MNSETRDYLNHWIKKAEEDITVIQKLTEYEIIASSAVCFHCQQAVEKFLKDFLIANNQEIVRTHNIEFLLAECSDIDKDFEKIDPLNLTDFGVDIRYPGDFCYPSEQEVIIYSNLALQIKNLVKSKIKL